MADNKHKLINMTVNMVNRFNKIRYKKDYYENIK